VSLQHAATHRCSVLVVDDDPDVRELLRVALAADGYDAEAVEDGRAALNHMRSHAETCIIVLDLMLPGMDAEMFRTAQLRDRSLAWIPVVLMSGSVDAGEKARGLSARAFIRKPLDLDMVRQTLRNIGCCHARPQGGVDLDRY
jgi:CheY-like chemotaxis protein